VPRSKYTGHAGAFERVFEQAGIVLRARSAIAMRSNGTPRRASRRTRRAISDRLAPFARRREQLDLVERIARRRHRFGKQVAADTAEAGGLAAIEHRRRRQRFERPDRRGVAVGDRHQRVPGACDERVHERTFRCVGYRHVQQDEPGGRRRMRGGPFGRRLGGDAQKGGAVNRRSGLKLPIETLEQIRQIAAGLGQDAQRRRLDGGDSQRFERSRQRAGESGHSRDRREVRQRAVPIRVEQRPRRHRLDTERGGCREPLPRQQRRCEPRGQLRQAEAIEAKRRAAAAGDQACEVVAAPRDAETIRTSEAAGPQGRTGAPRRGGRRPNRKRRCALRTPSGRHAGHSVTTALRGRAANSSTITD
jgi:hypothetical protein